MIKTRLPSPKRNKGPSLSRAAVVAKTCEAIQNTHLDLFLKLYELFPSAPSLRHVWLLYNSLLNPPTWTRKTLPRLILLRIAEGEPAEDVTDSEIQHKTSIFQRIRIATSSWKRSVEREEKEAFRMYGEDKILSVYTEHAHFLLECSQDDSVKELLDYFIKEVDMEPHLIEDFQRRVYSHEFQKRHLKIRPSNLSAVY